MGTPIVEIDNVSKKFDDVLAVDSIALQLSRGETLGLIGPNGSGKTTLLRMIATLTKPDQGDVRIDGRSVLREPQAARRMIGFMPAEFGSPRSLNIGEYLEYFGCLYAIPRGVRQQRIRDVCELTDLLDRQHVMVKGLSTGNRQRLLLAKTLLHDPQLLILDEPASGLDPRARAELRMILKELKRLGKTIIISSHILPDLEEVSDGVGILEAGRLVMDGNLADLRERQETNSFVVRVRIPSQHLEEATMWLASLDHVVSCVRNDPYVVIHSVEQIGNSILAELLARNIRVLQFAADDPSLEEIFLRSTTGKVT